MVLLIDVVLFGDWKRDGVWRGVSSSEGGELHISDQLAQGGSCEEAGWID